MRTITRSALDHPVAATIIALVAVLLLGLVGCSNAPPADSSDPLDDAVDAVAVGMREVATASDPHLRERPRCAADMGSPDMSVDRSAILTRLAICGNANVECPLGWGCDYAADCVPLCLGHELDGCDVDLASGDCALMCFTQGCRDLSGACPDGVGLRRGIDSYRISPSPRQQSISR